MKKIILLFTLICTVLTGFAQAPKGTAALDKTGGWIFYDWRNSNKILYNPLGTDENFPNIVYKGILTPYTVSPTLKEKLTQLRDIVKTAYPKPQGFSFLYSFEAIAQEKLSDQPRPIYFKCDPHGIENDGNGGLNTINIASAQGDERYAGEKPPGYLGLFSMSINSVHYNLYDFFPRLTNFDEVLKAKLVPNVSAVYMMPPKNNFATAILDANDKSITTPSALIGNKADNYFVFRHLHDIKKNNDGYFVGTIMNNIILTNKNKMPYQVLKRKTFLALLKLYYSNYNEKYKRTTNGTIKTEADWQLEIIEKLEELNASDLDKPATLYAEHKNIHKDLWIYWHDKKGNPLLQIEKLRNIFTTDPDNGYSICKKIKYYDSPNDEDFQTIQVNWLYEIPLSNNPKAATHISNDSKSFYQAIKNNFDWDKLYRLLLIAK